MNKRHYLLILIIYILIFFALVVPAGKVLIAGVVWDSETRLTNNSAPSSSGPHNGWTVATDSYGRVHVIWTDERNGNKEIYYKRWNGTNWETDRRLTNATGVSDGNKEIDYKRWNGTNWETDRRLTNATGVSGGASIAVDGAGIIHVTWLYYDGSTLSLRYSRSTDGGTNWSDYTDFGADATANPPAISAQGNTVYIFSTLIYGSYPEIVNIHSTNNGVSWSGVERMTQYSSYKENPVGAFGPDGKIHVVWQDDRDNTSESRREIYYKRYDGSWGSDVRLTYDQPNGSSDATIAVDKNNKVHVVWHDDRETDAGGNHIWNIYYKSSPDGGSTWPHNSPGDDYDQQFTFKSNDPHPTHTETDLPSMTADSNGNLHVVWEDRDVINDFYRIFYKCWNGSNWENNLNLVSGPSGHPSIASDNNGNIHVIWTDGRYAPNSEIYYRKGSPTGSILPPILPDDLDNIKVYPNPYTPSSIAGELNFQNIPSYSKIKIYTLLGELVKEKDVDKSGSATWNGKNASGRDVASGIYIVLIQTKDKKKKVAVEK